MHLKTSGSLLPLIATLFGVLNAVPLHEVRPEIIAFFFLRPNTSASHQRDV